MTPKEFLIKIGLRKDAVSVAIVCAPPDWEKKSVKKPKRKQNKMKSVW
mgnify:CR=1